MRNFIYQSLVNFKRFGFGRINDDIFVSLEVANINVKNLS